MNKSILIPFLACLVAHPASYAADAHVHGEARLDIALEDKTLEIALESPMANLVGFEHEPSTDEQRHALHEAHEALERIDRLVTTTPAAGCALEKVEVELAHSGEAEKDHHDGHEKHEEHEHHESHEHHDHETGGHSDGDVHAHFHCESPDELTGIEFKALFARFPDLHELHVQAIGPKGQTGTELTDEQTEFRF